MKICWDMLEDILLHEDGDFRKNGNIYVYKEFCEKCGKPYLTLKSRQSKFCSHSCVVSGKNHPMYGKTPSAETIRKISIANTGKVFSKKHRKNMSIAHVGKTVSIETRKKMSIACVGKRHSAEVIQKMSGVLHSGYKGGVAILGLTTYDTHKSTLGLYEDVRKQEGTEVLEVKCVYCGRWFIPTRNAVSGRLRAINNLNKGEGRFYCSENCKQACPTYGQLKYPKGFKHTTSREVSTYLRQLILERDNWTCQICGKTILEIQLHVHHMDPVAQNPMFQNDADSCITLCKICHKMVHSRIGCRYVDLRCKEKVSDQFTVKGYEVS